MSATVTPLPIAAGPAPPDPLEREHQRIVVEVEQRLRHHGFTDIILDLDKSHGSYLYDAYHDREILDFLSFYASGPISLNHPRLREPAFQRKLLAAATNKISNSDFYTSYLADFVAAFFRHTDPQGQFKYLFLIDGGALAVENALKAAFDWKVKKNIARSVTGAGDDERKKYGTGVIHFEHAFHGRSGYTLSLTNTEDPRKYRYFPKFDWPRIPAPAMVFPLTPEREAEVERLEEESLRLIEYHLDRDPHGYAAIIIEPIQCEGGDNHFRSRFFQRLRALCDSFEVLLIFDEVQTGCGMTGAMWAYEHFVKPDILVFGKKFQVCGLLCSERIDDVENHVFAEGSRLSSTFGGSLVDMVRCEKILEVIQEEELLRNAAAMGQLLIDELSGLAERYPRLVSNVRGRGLLCAFDLPDEPTRSRLRNDLMRHDLLIPFCGPRSLRFRPRLDIRAEDIGKAINTLDARLKAL